MLGGETYRTVEVCIFAWLLWLEVDHPARLQELSFTKLPGNGAKIALENVGIR